MTDGLENVVAAETVLSDVDGLAGRLVIRGLSLSDLAGRVSYEHTIGLLWDGFFPALPRDLTRPLAAARLRVFEATRDRFDAAVGLPPFDAVRMLSAALPDGTDLDTALMIAAAPGVLLPAVLRRAEGKAALAPDAGLGHAADILRMLRGTDAPASLVDGLDTYLVTVSDHGLNASTFTARVVASTQAGLGSSVLAAFGALKGPLHGGAPGPVLDMLDAVGTADVSERWIENALARGERLMGFGHRIYRVRDPRADALSAALDRLKSTGNVSVTRMALAAAVESAALAALERHKPDRPLLTNVEFYTALLLEALGFPREAFTAVFAIGRVGGWIAHAREQATTGRLIRPRSVYVGPDSREAA
jgi:citrate synthase